MNASIAHLVAMQRKELAMTLKDLIKLKWKVPSNSKVAVELKDRTIDNFTIQLKLDSDGQWMVCIQEKQV